MARKLQPGREVPREQSFRGWTVAHQLPSHKGLKVKCMVLILKVRPDTTAQHRTNIFLEVEQNTILGLQPQQHKLGKIVSKEHAHLYKSRLLLHSDTRLQMPDDQFSPLHYSE